MIRRRDRTFTNRQTAPMRQMEKIHATSNKDAETLEALNSGFFAGRFLTA